MQSRIPSTIWAVLLGTLAGTAAQGQMLLAAPVAAGSVLSSGDDAEFRAHMLSWTAPPVADGGDGQPLLAPVAIGRLSSGFGMRADPFGAGHRRHAGIDVPGRLGTPVLAAADGVVALARRTGGGYGNLVEIEHAGGLETRYAHLSQIDVLAGTPIKRGDVLGLMGSTGRSTGSHLHFEVRVDGRPTNPLDRLGEEVRGPTPPPRAVEPHWGGWTSGTIADRLPTSQIK